MKHLFKYFSVLLVLIIAINNQSIGQSLTSISIKDCQDWAIQHNPISQQYDFIEKATHYNLSNASKGYLPSISINAQAHYQSDVTELPIDLPNIDIDPLSKDQYRLSTDIYQPLLNGPIIKSKKSLIELKAAIDNGQLDVHLYQLKERVNQLYFGILLLDLQLQQMLVLSDDLLNAKNVAESAFKNGIATPGNVQLIDAEAVKVKQKMIHAASAKKAYVEMLALLTGQNIDLETKFEIPLDPVLSTAINRPELSLLELQRSKNEIALRDIDNRWIPNLGVFLQAGFGRPALNFLNNDFSPFYMGGIKLNWNLSQLYTSSTDRKSLVLEDLKIKNQKDIFLFNQNLEATQQEEELRKYQELIQESQNLVAIREEISEAAESQLEHGIITTSEYIQYLNAEHNARLDLARYEIQLKSAQNQLSFIKGN